MKTFLIVVSILICGRAPAQTTAEWLRQKETKKKYLLQQIAALKIYLDYAEKGYNIANHGLQTIRSIKKGDFILHNDFFNSLKQVNPAIKNWSRIADIIAVQMKIIKQTKDVLSSVQQSDLFTQEEIDYCKTVFGRLLDDCLKNIDALMAVTTAGELEMKDDERIKRIELLWLDIQDKYDFSSSFSDGVKLLSVQRMNEQKEIELSGIISK